MPTSSTGLQLLSSEAFLNLSATDNLIRNTPAEYHDAVGIFGGYLRESAM